MMLDAGYNFIIGIFQAIHSPPTDFERHGNKRLIAAVLNMVLFSTPSILFLLSPLTFSITFECLSYLKK
jgi:hypothetical protein